MKDIKLIPISLNDIEILDLTEYKNLSVESRRQLVRDSENGESRGEFFLFLLIKEGEEVIGVLNLCGHGRESVSIAPEIIEKHRNKGYAKASLTLAYEMAKKKGFKRVIAGIREENLISQRLHEKLGFKFIEDFVSKNGKAMKRYSKEL